MPVSHIPDRAGVARSHFYTVLGERGSATVDWIEQVAEALECDPVDLLCRR
jgi:DNA-binding phage protein